MKILHILSALAIAALPFQASSQDIIILKAGETQIKCHIVSVTDSIVEYRAWKSSDTTVTRLKSQEVLSYQLDKKTGADDIGLGQSDPDIGLLAIYNMGETIAGYIITSDNDTLEGFIQVKDVVANQFLVVFIDDQKNKKEYKPSGLKGYGYGQVQYNSVATQYTKQLHPGYTSENGQLFLHLIVSGASSAYRIYRVDFSKGTVAQNKFPPLYMGKLHHEFMLSNPEGMFAFSFGKSARGTLGTSYQKYPKFIKQMDEVKTIHKTEIPDFVRKFNGWFAEQDLK
jgi:hypothetical protein